MVNKLTLPAKQNDVVNKVNELVDDKQDTISDLTTIRSGAALGATAVQPSDLATVATSGSYNDLSNKPTIPSEVTEVTVSGWGFTKNTGTVTSVNNVSPVNGNVTLSIPTVNNPTITFTQGGTTKGTITLNQSSDQTIAFDAGGGGSSYTAGTGIDITNNQISVVLPDSYIQNTMIASGQVYMANLSLGIQNLINNAEQARNKVTSISLSSTDTQYPSAKCVYDIVGDIETLINAL